MFDVEFERFANMQAQLNCSCKKEEGNLLGYFTDNELLWGPSWITDNSKLDEYWCLPDNYTGKQEVNKELDIIHNVTNSL